MTILGNVKAIMGNSRSRVIFILTMLTLLIAVVVGVTVFSHSTQQGRAQLSGPPAIQSVAGGFGRPETPQYAKLVEEQNRSNLQRAITENGSAVPTIISAQDITGAPNNACSCAPTQAPTGLQTTGPAPLGIVCADGSVRNAQGQIIGHTGIIAPGGLVYDKNGHVIGTVGPDGKVRDANGNVIGTLGADGTVRDANGNVIGSTTTPASATGGMVGKPVYDKDGKLLGYVGADGKVRDATGKVLGTVGADGTVRDANGNIIGKAALGPKPGSLVYDKNGHVIGTVGADGKVRDANGKVIGTVGTDGTVRDANGNVIGTAAEGPKPGSLVYDKNGHVIGTVGADGKVRDANGKVIGTVGADGTVRDANGNVIGTAAEGPKPGSLVYDKNGHVIGTVGADGKVRDANGNVVGTVGPDGTVRDANGNVIGQANGAAPGTAVYDSQGHLLGTVGADGKVRDANGNVIGTVGPDGVVRDASGKPIGRTSYIAPGSAVFGPDGKLLGTVGADGRLVPANLGPGQRGVPGAGITGGTPQEQALARQQQMLGKQSSQKLATELQSAMSGQMSQLLAAWKPPTQQVITGSTTDQEGLQGAGGLGGKGGLGGGSQGGNTGPAFVKAGTIMFAVLDTAVNTDEPGPIMATITEGKLKGSRLLGTLSNQGQKAMLTFNTLSMPGASNSVAISTVAIDPATARTALSSETDNHYMLRYGTLFASTFLSGYAQAVTQSGSQTTYTLNGIVHTIPPLSSQQKLMVALGNTGSAYASVLGNIYNTPPTVKIYSGTGMGILFLSDLATPPGAAATDTQK